MNTHRKRKRSTDSPSKRAFISVNNRPTIGTASRSSSIPNSSSIDVNNRNFNCTVNLNDIMVRNFNTVSTNNKNQVVNNSVDKFNCRVLLTDIRNFPRQVQTDEPILKLKQSECGNGDLIGVKRCGSKRCLFQHKFFPKNKCISSVTFRDYDCIVPPGTIYLNCHSSNVIYLITCSKCSLQYVGETVQK